MSGRFAGLVGLAGLVVVGPALPGCETRVIRQTQVLSALRQQQGGGPHGSTGGSRAGLGERPRLPPIGELLEEGPDGSERLIVTSVRDLMLHIGRALEREDAALFAGQILSERTRREFLERGRDPEEALAMLAEDEAGVRRLFERMPLGEFTPGLYLRQVGDNVYRLNARGMPRGSRFTFIDVVFERGRWRLRWLGAE